MTRNLKALGLAALATLAMGAVFASGAQAEEELGIFTAGETGNPFDATIIGTQEEEPTNGATHNFFQHTPNEPKIICDLATYKGTLDEGKGTELTMTPEYKHCFGPGGRPATVNMNGCDYIFTQPTTIEEGAAYTGKADLTCPDEKVIEVTIFLFGNATNTTDSTPVCKIEVIPNGETTGPEGEKHIVDELDGHIVYKNEFDVDVTGDGEKRHAVTATATIEGITTNLVGGGCPAQGHHTNGVFNTAVTVYALEDGGEPHEEHLDTWIDHHPEQG